MKAKILWLTALTLLAALLLSGKVLAEGEDPSVPPPAPAEPINAPPAEVLAEPVETESDEAALAAAEPVEAALAEATSPVELSDSEPFDVQVPSELIDAGLIEATSPAKPVEAGAEDIQIVDASGEALDSASQTSANLIAAADPYFTSGGIKYSFYETDGACGSTPNCQDGFANPIQAAIDYIQTSGKIPTDGKIYVEKADYNGPVSFDGTLANLANLKGLIGLADLSGVFPTLNGDVSVSNTKSGFTLSGFTIYGSVDFSENIGSLVLQDLNVSGSTETGINVSKHKGNITATRVISTNHSENGADLDNTAGGAITINNSEFNDNDGMGLVVQTNGLVNLTNLKVCDNYFQGLNIYAPVSAVAVNSVVADRNGFDGLAIEGRGVTIRNIVSRDNYNNGLYVYLRGGTALLENITANDNGWYGVEIDAYPGVVAGVTLKNMGASSNNNGGISVRSLGAVAVSNCSTNNNYDSMLGRGGNGLYISTKGAVTLTSIWSSANGGNGLVVEGVYTEVWDDFLGEMVKVGMQSPTTITLTSPTLSSYANFFAANGQLDSWEIGRNGITFISEKPVIMRNFNVMDNLGEGVVIKGPDLYIPDFGWDYRRAGAVTITSTIPNWRNGADRNEIGIDIFSAGAVSLTGLNTNENIYHSVFIDTLGAITLRDVSDWGNKLGNSIGLYNNYAASFLPVTISNLETRETRGDSGAVLEVHSRGAITLSSVWIQDNKSMGAALGNLMGGRGNITLTNAFIENNHGGGIQTYANGAILFTNVHINNNGWGGASGITGAYLDNQGSPSAMPVTLTDCEFNYNQAENGLEVHSRGVITLRGVDARGTNDSYGELLEEITIFETNQPDWNWEEGRWDYYDQWRFQYYTGIPINIIIDAFGNFEPIVQLIDSNGEMVSPVAFWDEEGKWTANFDTLVQFEYYTVQVLFNEAFGNGYGAYALSINDDNQEFPFISSNGAVLDNSASTTAGVLVGSSTMRPFVEFEGNNNHGLDIRTNGTVTLTNLNAHNNTFGDGVHLDNSGKGAVTIQSKIPTNPSWFGENGSNGVYIRTQGAITLSNINSERNGLSGADLDNCLFNEDQEFCLGSSAINIKAPSGMHNNFNQNGHFGIWAVSKSAITVSNIRSTDNGSDGVLLWNDRGTSSAAVTVNTIGALRNEIRNNGWNLDYLPWYPSEKEEYWVRCNGLTIMSGGNITVVKTDVTENRNEMGWSGGILALNDSSITPKTVLITDSESSRNDMGLIIHSNGSITLTKFYAFNNNNFGINLDNCLDDGFGVCAGSGAITVTTAVANNNNSQGFQAYSKGIIKLTSVDASNNSGGGVKVQNNFSGSLAGIILSGVSGNNNPYTGIDIQTNGSLTMANIAANENILTHGKLGEFETVQDFYNINTEPDHWWFDATAGQDYEITLLVDGYGWSGLLNRMDFDPWIELIDPNAPDGWENPLDISEWLTCTYNDSCFFTFDPGVDKDGFRYTGTNTFVMRLGSHIGDGFYRLSLNDDDPDDSTNAFWVSGLNFTAGGNVTLTGNNDLNSNSLAGFAGTSGANISLANVCAFNNGAEGIYLDNSAVGGNITLTGSNIAGGNGWEGLRVSTLGTVSITNLEASYNSHRDLSEDIRASVRVQSLGIGKTVTLTNVMALYNNGDGLYVQSFGPITLTKVLSSLNNWSGAWVDSSGSLIKVLNSVFMCNGYDGFAYIYGPLNPITTGSIFWANDNYDLIGY